jgi:hypothetical protein
MHVLGWSIVLIVGALIAVNASVMLASPKAWFRLPGWMLLKGTLTDKKYGQGWGATQVRLTGAIMLSVIMWVLYDALIR